MYLYLGQDTVVCSDSIVGIFDLENTSTSRVTKHYLAMAQKTGQIREVTTEIPKSFVVCREKDRTIVYLSQISPTTLKKRAEHVRQPTGL